MSKVTKSNTDAKQFIYIICNTAYRMRNNVMLRVTINVVGISWLYWFYKKTRLARKPSANGLVLPLFLRYSHQIHMWLNLRTGLEEFCMQIICENFILERTHSLTYSASLMASTNSCAIIHDSVAKTWLREVNKRQNFPVRKLITVFWLT